MSYIVDSWQLIGYNFVAIPAAQKGHLLQPHTHYFRTAKKID